MRRQLAKGFSRLRGEVGRRCILCEILEQFDDAMVGRSSRENDEVVVAITCSPFAMYH